MGWWEEEWVALERLVERLKLCWLHELSRRRLGMKRFVNAWRVGKHVQIIAVTISIVLEDNTVSELDTILMLRCLFT